MPINLSRRRTDHPVRSQALASLGSMLLVCLLRVLFFRGLGQSTTSVAIELLGFSAIPYGLFIGVLWREQGRSVRSGLLVMALGIVAAFFVAALVLGDHWRQLGVQLMFSECGGALVFLTSRAQRGQPQSPMKTPDQPDIPWLRRRELERTARRRTRDSAEMG